MFLRISSTTVAVTITQNMSASSSSSVDGGGGGSQYYCDKCKQTFSENLDNGEKETYAQHRASTHLSCTCRRKYTAMRRNEHQDTFHPYVCNICPNARFTLRTNLQRHTTAMHSMQVKCILCGIDDNCRPRMWCTSKQTLRDHVAQHHPGDDMMLYQSELTCDVTLYGPKTLTISDLLQQKYRKTFMLRRAETGSMIGESATESTIEAEVRLSQKSVETLQMSLIKAKQALSTIVKDKTDLLAAVPRQDFKGALAQLLGRNGIMAGCGFPSTANDLTTNKNLFATMMKNKSTSLTPTLFWTSLCVFNHPVSREKQEDRYALVTTTTDKHGSFYHNTEDWYNISLIVERINVETKQLSKPNSSISFSANEVDKLLAFFRTSQMIRKYFPVTL